MILRASRSRDVSIGDCPTMSAADISPILGPDGHWPASTRTRCRSRQQGRTTQMPR
jgi:hypothetical protein